MEKSSEVYRRNNSGPKTLPYGTPDTTLTSLLRHLSTKTNCDRLDKNCVSTDNTEPPIPTENSLMVDPIKSSAEIGLHNPGLLPTLQCPLQCVWHTQMRITSTQTFPISKLGGWKHTTVFHKSTETNRHQTLRHLWQYWCYGNWSVIGNRGGRWTFWNWGDIGLSPASRETTQTKKPSKHLTEVGSEHQPFSSKWEETYQEGQCHPKGLSQTGDV